MTPTLLSEVMKEPVEPVPFTRFEFIVLPYGVRSSGSARYSTPLSMSTFGDFAGVHAETDSRCACTAFGKPVDRVGGWAAKAHLSGMIFGGCYREDRTQAQNSMVARSVARDYGILPLPCEWQQEVKPDTLQGIGHSDPAHILLND